jgi:hypothetical protein
MIKSMAVVALGVAMFACGCNCPDKKNKDMNSSEPKKMSVSGNTGGNGVAKCTQGECCDKSAAKPK